MLAPSDHDLYKAIDTIAIDHLGFDEARRTLRKALEGVKTFKKRDAIAFAHTDVMIATEAVYYYAGLAFCLTLADLGNRGDPCERSFDRQSLEHRPSPARALFVNGPQTLELARGHFAW